MHGDKWLPNQPLVLFGLNHRSCPTAAWFLTNKICVRSRGQKPGRPQFAGIMKAKMAVCLVLCLLVSYGARADGFLFSGGTYSRFNYPGSTTTMPFAINDNDVIVGWYTDSSGDNHGFVKTGGTFSSIDYPGAVEPFGTTIIGINNSGTMVGSYWDGSVSHGFLYSAGSFTALDYPGAIESQPFGIDSNGDVVGFYWDGTETHGFLYREALSTLTMSPPRSQRNPIASMTTDK